MATNNRDLKSDFASDDSVVGSALLETSVHSTDPGRVEELLLSHWEPLSAHIRARFPLKLRPSVTADDILQETLMCVFRDIRSFQPRNGRHSFLAWLKRIADDRMKDAMRHAQRKKRGGSSDGCSPRQAQVAAGSSSVLRTLADEAHTPRRAAANQEAAGALHIAMAGLPLEQYHAVRHRFFDGKSLTETAEAMGTSTDAVRGLLARAKQKLRLALRRSSRWMLD